tara:strand:+ start:110 stop:445 length:336 start_codon:yes stop_codon:yes gene_type:complete
VDNTITKCGHSIHTSCLIKWIRTGKNTCPLCRDALIDETNSLSYDINSITTQYLTTEYSLRTLRIYRGHKRIGVIIGVIGCITTYSLLSCSPSLKVPLTLLTGIIWGLGWI